MNPLPITIYRARRVRVPACVQRHALGFYVGFMTAFALLGVLGMYLPLPR